ncbi:uncharacterized protein F4822DRAFT_444459 [Hypoxylon trugodes]|uniref:uncharacterized protein n=1 Tax=Hypoxylon trugodes TaxID=326681 RepID=UPI00218D0967|nr:uncharacterized protein F4822DRAFT_444459 [Hypoxylon trugodes]KAI1387951.1 hypothetical protein F4822DRAFT_444459 [Hypoxylon trugodes]
MSQETSSNGAKRFNERDMAVLKKSHQKQIELRRFASKHISFSEKERLALQFDSVAGLNNIWDTALEAKSQLEAGHEHGVGLMSKRLQDSATAGYVILQQIEPILRLVKDFGAPYGGMAVGTISFLFAIVHNRAKMERDISDMLLQIKDRVAGLRLYRHIYNADHELDHQLQSKIVHTYVSFVDFCIEAIQYYSQGSIRRWAKALWASSTTLEGYALEVQKAIVDIRYMGEELLNKNVDIIKEQVSCQEGRIKDLLANIESIDAKHPQHGLKQQLTRALLCLKDYSLEQESTLLQKYKVDLKANLEYVSTDLERMLGSRLEKFKNGHDFRAWQDSSRSCMLILAGYNNISIYRTGECWLSPVALDMIESFRRPEQNDPCAFYILGLQEHNLLYPVLSRIILQLLILNPQVLRDDTQYQELCAEIESYRTTAQEQSRDDRDCSNTLNDLLQNLALRVLNMFDPSKPIWIIIDRVDKCKLDRSSHRKRLMRALAYLVKNSSVKIRVLVTVNGYDWKVEEERTDFDPDGDTRIIIHTAHQKETT